MSWTTGYKAFDNVDGRTDAGTCRGFLFEEGKKYQIDSELELCENGFHACKDAVLCFDYYPNATLFAEIEFLGKCDYEQPTKHKGVTSEIYIKRFFHISELLNDDRRNSGDSNSGDSNSGYWNSGYSNSGNSNSGNWNSGNWNSCNRETGYFNSKSSETIRVFNKPCKIEDWEDAEKPDFIYFEIDEEIGYKESFKKSFENASERDIKLLKGLPNFDADVFYEISGIRI